VGTGFRRKCSTCDWEFTELTGIGFAGVELAAYWCPTCRDLRNCKVAEEPRCRECEGVVMPKSEAPRAQSLGNERMDSSLGCPRCGSSLDRNFSIIHWD